MNETDVKDAEMLRWLLTHLEDDGTGFWLPNMMLVDSELQDIPAPTLDQARAALAKKIAAYA